MLSETIKQDLTDGLCRIFGDNIRMIILYGSVVRGEETPESDIDIAVVIDKSMGEETQNAFIEWAADMDLRYDKVFSIIDVQNENLKKWGNILPFYINMQKEGVVLWKAA